MGAYLILWVISGSVWWMCAHSMTLIFPLPGPWLPVERAVPVGVMMGLLGFALFRGQRGASDPKTRLLLQLVGAVAGLYLGWTHARGPLTETQTFLLPTLRDKELSAVVCGGLGLAANTGTLWLIQRFGERPIRLLAILLLLLSIVFAAVFLLAIHANVTSPPA